MEGYIPVGAGRKGKAEGAALSGSPDSTAGGTLRLLRGPEPSQPRGAGPAFMLLTTEVLAGDCSGSTYANKNSSDIFPA